MDTRTKTEKHLMDITPWHLGSRVKVNPEYRYASEWRGVYVVVGMRWNYASGSFVNIEIASDEEIQAGYGSTDGFGWADLLSA